MIDIRREKMFADDVYVLDHIKALDKQNVSFINDKDYILQIYKKKLNKAKKNSKYKHFAFYAATDGWTEIFDSFVKKNNLIPFTGNLNCKDWNWFPHWLVVTDSIDPLPCSKTVPDYRWHFWVRRPRPNRIELLKNFSDLNINNGEIVFPKKLVEPTGRVFPSTKELFGNDRLYDNISDRLNLPIDIEVGTNGAYVPGFELRQKRAIDIVTETMYSNEGGIFISEKTFKPIRAGQLFVVLGQKGTIKSLHNYGFKIFDKWIDHSYDDVEDMPTKAKMIAKEISRISNLSHADFLQMWVETYADRKHNQTYKNYKLDYWKKYLNSFFV